MSKQNNLTTARPATMQDLYYFFGLTDTKIAEVEASNPEQMADKDRTAPSAKQVERSISSTFRRSQR